MSEPLKRLGVENILSSLRGTSPAVSKESLASAPRRTGPSPQAVAGPSSSASAPPKTRLPHEARSGLEVFLTSASDLLPPLQPVISGLVDFFEAYQDVLAADSDYAKLQEDLELLLKTLNSSFSSDDPIIVNLCSSIDEELDKIARREEGGTGRRLWEANKDLVKARACRDQIRGHVDTATLKIVGGHGKVLAQQGKDLAEYKKRVDELGKSAENREIFSQEDLIGKEFKGLRPSLAARYNSSEATNLRRECTQNTRTEVLSHLDNWRCDPKQGNIFWMNGMAGTGKTTIAKTLCATLEKEQKLGASFFCSRQLPECRNVKRILPTIAYQLARFSSSFRDALFKALESDPDLLAKDLPAQLEGLILGPSRAVTPPFPADLVIVIDALDECDEHTGIEQILEVFVARASDLPLKVFLSSRPEEEIRRMIGDTQARVILHELNKEVVKEDIGLYLREELMGTSVLDNQLAELVERAGVLFIYASTVARFIKSKSSSSGQQERLGIVLRKSSASGSHKDKVIDALYGTVLDSAFNKPGLEKFERDRMSNILHMVVCAQEPLTADALAGLLQLRDGGLVLDALEPLWSVVHVSGFEGARLVTTLHASFPDYMFDSDRSKEHCCDATGQHGQLAERCLARIENNAQKFNICGLESSYVRDEQVPNLQQKINNAIPLALSYASQYWAVHLELGGWSADRVQPLENFLKKRLLMWMEVLNLKSRMNTWRISSRY